jgi:ribosomal protein S12 methylthiotransferase
MKHSFHIVTLGCPKNLVDSEGMAALLAGAGLKREDEARDAEVIIINTCCFIEPAREEAIAAILEAAAIKEEKGGFLIVTGCLPQRYRDEISREIPEVDSWMGLEDPGHIVDVVKKTIGGKGERAFAGEPPEKFQAFPRQFATPGHYAYLKIAEGCSHQCSFCVIPAIRGSYRSSPMETVLQEARAIAASGRGEVILIAQDTTLYGVDLYGRKMLPELLRRLSDIDGLRWIRLMYAYPSSLDRETLKVIAAEPKICKYLDVPLQHSHPDVLQVMGRPGREGDARRAVEEIREHVPGAVIRTTFIVGHPGETEKRFMHLLDFVRDMEFYHAGVFTYSPEEGTPSALLTNRASGAQARRRREILMEAQQEICLKLRRQLTGSTIPAVCEEILEGEETGKAQAVVDIQEDGQAGISAMPPGTTAIGRTILDAPDIDGRLYVQGPPPAAGSFFQARITGASPYDLSGKELIAEG